MVAHKTAGSDRYLLEMIGIQKSFPGVHALKGVDLNLGFAEVLALVGENGAGKSTLIKVLGGVYSPESGAIRIEHQEVKISSPIDAQHLGVAIIHQEFNLIPHLTARENIFLGGEQTRIGFVRRGNEAAAAGDLFKLIGVHVDPEARVSELTIAQQQVVEIAKALRVNARIIVMDEPSAALTIKETERLFQIIRDLKSQGISVIYISHRLEEIFHIADRVTVIRDGQCVDTNNVASINRERIIEMMVGRKIENEFPSRPVKLGAVRLVVRDLCRGNKVRNVSFDVRCGEILALTGLVGAGRTETARLIFGADRPDAGEVWLDGRPLRIRSPRDAIASGICLLTEDRKSQGLVLVRPVRENFGLPNLRQFSLSGFLQLGSERKSFSRYVKTLQIKISDQEQLTKNLSGGNQQKVVLAKWLQANCDVVIFDEPTRGIDVGAKYEIYLLINKLAQAGKAIIMISSELPEVLGMSDRVLVMSRGRVTGEIKDVARATQEQILHLAIG